MNAVNPSALIWMTSEIYPRYNFSMRGKKRSTMYKRCTHTQFNFLMHKIFLVEYTNKLITSMRRGSICFYCMPFFILFEFLLHACYYFITAILKTETINKQYSKVQKHSFKLYTKIQQAQVSARLHHDNSWNLCGHMSLP